MQNQAYCTVCEGRPNKIPCALCSFRSWYILVDKSSRSFIFPESILRLLRVGLVCFSRIKAASIFDRRQTSQNQAHLLSSLALLLLCVCSREVVGVRAVIAKCSLIPSFLFFRIGLSSLQQSRW
jgi:hypothetical protein